MANITAPVFAVSTFTVTDNFDDTETVVIGGKTYTGELTLTNVDGHFLIDATAGTSADAPATLDNLAAAINLGSIAGGVPGNGTGAGTLYAAATTAGMVLATRPTSLTLKIWSKVPGTVGNMITTTDTHGEGSWTSTVMAGGTGVPGAIILEILAGCQLNAELIAHLNAYIEPFPTAYQTN